MRTGSTAWITGLNTRAMKTAAAPLPSCVTARSSGPTLGAACSPGFYDYDPDDRLNKVRLRFHVPPEGVLVTGFCAGPTGATLDIVGAFERTAHKMTTVVEVSGASVEVQLTYLGPLPNEKPSGHPSPCGNER